MDYDSEDHRSNQTAIVHTLTGNQRLETNAVLKRLREDNKRRRLKQEASAQRAAQLV